MSSIYKLFETDLDIEKQGVVLQYGKTVEGKPITIRIARAGGSNTKFQKVLEARTKPLRRIIQNDLLEVKVADEMMMEVFADAVVLGWENIQDKDGVDMPYNRENVIKLFTDLPDLFVDVREQATKQVLFRSAILEVEAKNS